jgi:beta-galactosidase
MEKKERIDILGNPEIFQENRMSSCSDHKWYESAEEAVLGNEMPLKASLNGVWKFMWCPNPMGVPEGVEQKDFSTGGWQDIQVPGHMELQGFGKPQYTDTTYPWKGCEDVKPREVPQDINPTGIYVKHFTLSETFEGKRCRIHFEGVETAFFCWLNGVYIGYSEDSYTPAVFDITDALQQGKNKLCVQVSRFSTGAWLEDQDFWRMGGIIRDVTVSAIPKVHIQDIEVKTDVVNDYQTGKLEMALSLDAETGAYDDILVEYQVFDPAGEQVTEKKTAEINKSEHMFTAAEELQNISLWSAEIPNLYRIMFCIMDKNGNPIEYVSQQIGFRKVEIRDAILYMNGKRLILNGVNRHEFSGYKGRAIGREEMEWDVRFLKQNNFNAVRTSHYPNQSYWYELCDKYGLYVMDETNLETHGTWHMGHDENTLPGDFPEWKQACISRAETMLERDKNHPCIFSWSVGNESWSGQNLYDMSMYFRNRDNSRPVHYENVCHDRKWGGTTDFESRMYATVDMAREYLLDNPEKPYILCEYSHAMGNSCGNLIEYTNLADEFPEYCGGFIWDYIDQSLIVKDMFGEETMAYGGDFDDRPADYNFCTNGLLYSDRGISPKVPEVKYCYQPFTLIPDKKGVNVKNRNLFTDGSGWKLLWSVEQDGEILTQCQWEISVEPLKSRYFSISEEAEKVVSSLGLNKGEYIINASVILAEDTIYAKAGHECAFGQTVMKISDTDRSAKKNENYYSESKGTKEAGIKVIDDDTVFSVICDTCTVMYQKLTGKLVSYKIGGKELVYDSLHTLLPNFWRAPVDNDEGCKMKLRCAPWKTASLYQNVKEVFFKADNGEAEVKVVYEMFGNALCSVTHFISADGSIRVNEVWTIDEENLKNGNIPELPCFGMSWKLPLSMQQIKWYGKGPVETYTDRCEGSKLGIHHTTPEEGVAKYVVPQECGNHVQTRWVEITDEKGVGIRISGEIPFEFSVLPFTCHELEEARHLYELPRPYASVLRINSRQRGIGGDNSWGAEVHEPYRIYPEKELEFTFVIRPL